MSMRHHHGKTEHAILRQPRRTTRRWGSGALLLVVLGAGCASESASAEGETHWLIQCSSDEQCGSELACWCGICTRACAGALDCEDLGESAACEATEAISVADRCESNAPSRICAQPDTNQGGTAGAEGLGNAGRSSNGGDSGATSGTGGIPGAGGGSSDTGGSSGEAGGTAGEATGGSSAQSLSGAAGAPSGGSAGQAGSGGSSGSSGSAGLAGSGQSSQGGGGDSSAGGASEAGGGSEAGGSGGATGGSAGASGQAGHSIEECAALGEAIAEQVSGVHACTAVVRLDFLTQDILGFQLLCAPYATIDEATARQTSDDDTGYGLDADQLAGDDPEDEYVFHDSPDDFGGVGVVNARNGATVFGGSIVWAGTGDITYPASWQPASAMGPDCIPEVNALPPPARGIDVGGGQGTMTQAFVDELVEKVWISALPDGLLLGHYVFDAVVLGYARSVGAVNPDTAEYVVMINTGWLE